MTDMGKWVDVRTIGRWTVTVKPIFGVYRFVATCGEEELIEWISADTEEDAWGSVVVLLSEKVKI